MAERFRVAGVTVPPQLRATPDHLVLELEFMAHLAKWGTPQGTPALTRPTCERH